MASILGGYSPGISHPIVSQDTREYRATDWYNPPMLGVTGRPYCDFLRGFDDRIRLDPDANFILGLVIREDPHCKVYEVVNRQLGRMDLVARVYHLDTEAVPPKVRRHRLRCIKRLASRMEFESSVPDFRIVVCRDGSLIKAKGPGVPSSRECPTTSALSKEEETRSSSACDDHVVDKCHEAPEKTPARHRKRTPYQQASKRARQRDRRQAARRATRQKSTEPEGRSDGDGEDPGETENFWMLVLLYLAYDEKGQLREHIPPNATQALQGMNSTPLLGYMQQYLERRTIDFASAEQMQEYIRVKQSEIIFLKRQQSKMGRVDQYYKDKCLLVMREQQARQAPGSKAWKETQHGVTQFAKHRLMVVRHVTKALPEVIRRAEETHKELRSRVVQVRQQEEKREAVEALRREEEALRKQLGTLTTWYSSVVPLSTTYRELAEKWTAVEGKLKSAEAAHGQARTASRVPEAVPRDLLRVHVK